MPEWPQPTTKMGGAAEEAAAAAIMGVGVGNNRGVRGHKLRDARVRLGVGECRGVFQRSTVVQVDDRRVLFANGRMIGCAFQTGGPNTPLSQNCSRITNSSTRITDVGTSAPPVTKIGESRFPDFT